MYYIKVFVKIAKIWKKVKKKTGNIKQFDSPDLNTTMNHNRVFENDGALV